MKKKNIFLIVSAVIFLSAGFGLLYLNNVKSDNGNNVTAKTPKQDVKAPKPMPEPKAVFVKNNEHKKAELYNSYLDKIPMESIKEVANADKSVQESVNKLLESSSGIYFVKSDKKNNSVVILSENYDISADKYPRHNLLLTTIFKDKKIKQKKYGYEGLEGETENSVSQKSDLWVYEENSEPLRPISHTVYGNNKKIVFIETWNYSDDEPVKYEMKDGEGRVLSILKETVDNNVNYRKEHIFYDKDGNTEMSISASYEGSDLKRVNYYSSSAPQDSFMIENSYDNGLKTEEKVYNNELQLIETIKANYDSNGEIKEIQINDSQGNELNVIEQAQNVD